MDIPSALAETRVSLKTPACGSRSFVVNNHLLIPTLHFPRKVVTIFQDQDRNRPRWFNTLCWMIQWFTDEYLPMSSIAFQASILTF
ncbi:MAG: hypothetical protein RBR67_15055 [Desulfobacterium sp.]|nr:hypothetical protein [Desulfobacterium sp.]